MTKDLNKDVVTMSWNSLNLPDTIQLKGGHMESFIYDAAGQKEQVTRVTVTTSNVTIPIGRTLNNAGISVTKTSAIKRYASNVVYSDNRISEILLPDGILKRTNAITSNPPVFSYNYYIKDHLGNVRTVIDGSGTIKQVNNYYPFGMEYGESAENQTMMTYQDYQYGGKEFDRKFEINLYDFHARPYDATRAQWTSPDPLAEKYYSISPYTYCANNPLKFVDPDGRIPRIYVETKGVGHTFITTGKGENTTVYTYGRYGGLDKDKSIGRSLSMSGEGVLVVMKGEEALNYIAHEYKQMGASIFELKNASDEKINKYYAKMFESSSQRPSSGKYKNADNAKVIDTYDLLDNNCTTKTAEAVKIGTDGDLDLQSKGPANIDTKLNYEKQKDGSKVKQIHLNKILEEYEK